MSKRPSPLLSSVFQPQMLQVVRNGANGGSKCCRWEQMVGANGGSKCCRWERSVFEPEYVSALAVLAP